MRFKKFLILTLFLAALSFAAYLNEPIRSNALIYINSIKEKYKEFIKEIEEKKKSYLAQKETIEKLQKENQKLKEYLLNQAHFIEQLSQIYKDLPSLESTPHKAVALVNTISYVKLNKFNEILLTKPKHVKLKPNKLYGLIQNDVAAGTAEIKNGSLYGYLLSNQNCQFSVFVGENRVPGVAQGVNADTMVVKFVPKWAKVFVGDKVETSGMDDIFFPYIPVGIVTKIEVEESYKKLYIKTFADTLNPKLFFLIFNPRPYLAASYDPKEAFPCKAYPFPIVEIDPNAENNISSIPITTTQTKDEEVNDKSLEVPKEKLPNIKDIDKERKNILKKFHNIENKKRAFRIKKAKRKNRVKPKIKIKKIKKKNSSLKKKKEEVIYINETQEFKPILNNPSKKAKSPLEVLDN